MLKLLKGTWEEINNPTLAFRVIGEKMYDMQKGIAQEADFNIFQMASPYDAWFIVIPFLGIVFGWITSLSNNALEISDIANVSGIAVDGRGKVTDKPAARLYRFRKVGE